jgi:hypothetical protein
MDADADAARAPPSTATANVTLVAQRSGAGGGRMIRPSLSACHTSIHLLRSATSAPMAPTYRSPMSRKNGLMTSMLTNCRRSQAREPMNE